MLGCLPGYYLSSCLKITDVAEVIVLVLLPEASVLAPFIAPVNSFSGHSRGLPVIPSHTVHNTSGPLKLFFFFFFPQRHSFLQPDLSSRKRLPSRWNVDWGCVMTTFACPLKATRPVTLQQLRKDFTADSKQQQQRRSRKTESADVAFGLRGVKR